MGSETGGDEDRRRTVRAADDTDGGGFLRGEAEELGAHIGHEDTELGSRTEQQGLGVGDQGTEVGHGADAHEDQAGIDAELDAEVEDIEQAEVDRRAGKLHAVHRGSLFGLCNRLCLRGELADGAAGSSHDLTGDLLDRIRSEGLLRAGEQLLEVRSKHGVRNAGLAHLRNKGGRDGRAAEKVPMDVTAGKQDLMEHIRAGQVGTQHTEGNGQEQQRLKALHNGQIHEDKGNGDHDEAFPVTVLTKHIEAGLLQEIDNSRHLFLVSFHSLFQGCAEMSQPMTHRTSPGLTAAPLETATEETVPSQGAKISFSIFMASRMKRMSPDLTA